MELLDRSLGQLARRIPGATAVFHQHGLDFCCGGNKSLRKAAEENQLDANKIQQQLTMLNTGELSATEKLSPAELIDYILERYHAVHRQELPELIRLADKVEHVHGDNLNCPKGLTAHLVAMQRELEMHMQKEEQILFPLIKQGAGPMVLAPIGVMRHEHDDHGEALRELERLTNGMQYPQGACNTWRALYLGLRKLKEDLMEHIHLENNQLFASLEESFNRQQQKINASCCGTCGGH